MLFRILTALFFGLLATVQAQAQGKSIIVLDASGSMWGQIDGRPKLEIARDALAEVLQGLPAETELGLMAYGHREKGNCADIELVVPPGKGTGPAIIAAAAGMQFLGKTPLTEAVRRAAQDLRSSEDKATVILITDGVETCEAAPCALGAELEASGVDFTAHVVGFGLSAKEGKQVSCLAEATGGLYIDAGDLSALTIALQTTVIAAPEPVVPAPAPAPAALEFNLAPRLFLAPGGPEIPHDEGHAWEVHTIALDAARGERLETFYGQTKTLIPAGTYRLVGRLDQAEAEQDITLTADTLAAPELVLNAGRVILHPRATEGGPVEADAAVRLTSAAGMDTTNYGDTDLVLPAGRVEATARLGSASVTVALTLAPGQVLEQDLVIGAGVAVIDGYYVEGMKMDSTGHSVEVLSARQALDGSRESLGTQYGPAQAFSLPPGDYIARVRQDAATADAPFSLRAGERVAVAVVLNAGALAISAPGASSIEVMGPADLAGNRPSLAFHYTDTTTLIAPPGPYLVQAKRGEVFVDQTANVTAGQRTEITLP